MKRILLMMGVALGVGVLAAPVVEAQQAEPELRTEQVRFDPGTNGTTIRDRVTGRETVAYTLGAEAGQRMQVSLTSSNTATYFNVYAPGSGPNDTALAAGTRTGPSMPEINRFDGVLPSSGEYTISVFLFRNAARRGERADYTLDISVTGDIGATVQGDYADGLQGGPDVWRVDAGTGLNLRDAPSTGGRIVMNLPNGLELRNLGCRMAEGRRWCRVATRADPGVEGWAAGDFLVEASVQTATQLPSMAPVQQGQEDAIDPQTGYNATGQVECYAGPGAEPQQCDFGVVREGNGTGTVTVTLPDGPSRAIFYDGGMPIAYDKSEADGDLGFETARVADGYMVSIGPARFVIPDAVIYGG
ncbi:MAG: SH3 domain-containing protein [Salinarimonas sp.]